MWNFTIHGNPVTKKNSQQILMNPKTHRPFVAPSSQYKKYEKDACKQLLMQAVQNGPAEAITFPVNIECDFFMQTRRLVDLTNLLEAVCDALTAAGIIADDNCSIAVSHDGSRVHYDKDNPRTEIRITKTKTEEWWKK